MSNQNKIQNPETPVEKSPKMSDRDFLNDVLATEKYLNASYTTALNELSHNALFENLSSVANDTRDMQRELYNLMFQKGWYSLEKAEAQKIEQSLKQFSDYKDQFPYGQGVQ